MAAHKGKLLWRWLEGAAQVATVLGGVALVGGAVTYVQSERNEWSKSYGAFKGLRDQAVLEVVRLQGAAPAAVPVAAAPLDPAQGPSASATVLPSPAPGNAVVATEVPFRQNATIGESDGLQLARWMLSNCAAKTLRERAISGTALDDPVIRTCQTVQQVRAAARDLLQRRNTPVARWTEWLVSVLRLVDDQARLTNELGNVLETASPLDAANWLMRIKPSAVQPPFSHLGHALAINVLAKDQVVFRAFLTPGLYKPDRLVAIEQDARSVLSAPYMANAATEQRAASEKRLNAFFSEFSSVHHTRNVFVSAPDSAD